MTRLLHIEASPMGEYSFSSRVAEAFLAAYRQTHPDDAVEVLNIWHAELPVFDGEGVRARYKLTRGQACDGAEQAAWDKVSGVVEHFKRFDKYLLSVPMWNFSIPWRLKQYIDLLVHPGLTFSFSPENGYSGLVTGRKAALICARGGAYPVGTAGAAYDFQKPYLETFLGFIGISEVSSITVEPVMGPGAEQMLVERQDEARILAANF